MTGSEQLWLRQTKAAAPLRRIGLGACGVIGWQSIATRRVQHDAGGVRQFSCGAEQRLGLRTLADHDDFRAGETEIEPIQKRQMAKDILGRAAAARRRTAASIRSRHFESPVSAASRTRFCAISPTMVRDGVVDRRVRPHDQPFGIVGREIIAAVFGVGIMRVEARLPASACSRYALSPVASNNASAARIIAA